ncbi:hypothetical protein [Campylobacter fetus]|uniref:Uncharacterized protein n=3 Tax=Campylobacter fetus TaxID=196 RepID=A0A825BC14_CAMFE|nr:hypothetical protein [Campylobacter fetus]OCS25301.1 hypothetical protein CFVB10_09200 [Campylobacter fetus subsp. venerealis cfvB10]AIR80946.1 hypothetical protein CFV97608_1329 [Campylobacter fetus subsp. venerealis 97/608]EAI8859965.1 hypothetical protein [Campylobacter fetus]EAJ1232642.1 hypothetical protein [Campylobacter fetus]EAK0414792.1 hypothetical protein [Campylobacter fetus]
MQKITLLPQPPNSKDTANFDNRADDFVGALPSLCAEINTLSTEFEVSNALVASTATNVAAQLEIAKNYSDLAQLAKQGIDDILAALKDETLGDNPENRYAAYIIANHPELIRDLEQLKTTFIDAINASGLSQYVLKNDLDSYKENLSNKLKINSNKITSENGVIDLSLGRYFVLNLSSAVTLSVINPPENEEAYVYFVELINAGNYTVTWQSGVKWNKDQAPGFEANKVDIIGFLQTDKLRGFRVGKNIAR